ncbi:hypothetical protein CARUB_v10015297mg [Capsella rubella]|uniref:Uncharacterized protein n=1 Tax=Capsella rubella TaxID=81985 RepID=R0G8V4_9BRAS|nr:hypothetical protein CARUB_v10015297mg [Capsella rubella]
MIPFPLLPTPIETSYRACTIPYRFPRDNPKIATPTEISWINVFANSIPSFKKRAESDTTVLDAPATAEIFAKRVCLLEIFWQCHLHKLDEFCVLRFAFDMAYFESGRYAGILEDGKKDPVDLRKLKELKRAFFGLKKENSKKEGKKEAHVAITKETARD